jgi:hypothetical protein
LPRPGSHPGAQRQRVEPCRRRRADRGQPRAMPSGKPRPGGRCRRRVLDSAAFRGVCPARFPGGTTLPVPSL